METGVAEAEGTSDLAALMVTVSPGHSFLKDTGHAAKGHHHKRMAVTGAVERDNLSLQIHRRQESKLRATRRVLSSDF